MNGVLFGTKHSYKDFGLILSKTDITIPVPKTKTVDVPGADGVIDLTETLIDDVKYQNRKLTFTFTVIDPMFRFPIVLSDVSNYLHGQRMRIYRDVDPNYYYEGRCTVNKFETKKRLATIVVDCDVDPYKYDKYTTSEPWQWDPFSFIDGIIYNGDVVVDGELTVTLVNRRKVVSPTFTCSEAMTAEFNGQSYDLKKGTTTLYDIRLLPGENEITFKGNGTVQIDYKVGSL